MFNGLVWFGIEYVATEFCSCCVKTMVSNVKVRFFFVKGIGRLMFLNSGKDYIYEDSNLDSRPRSIHGTC